MPAPVSKLSKVMRSVRSTEVEEGGKARFLATFFLTKCMNFSLRRIPSLGNAIRKSLFAFPRREFIIRNSIGRWSVLPFDDTSTISSEYFEEDLIPWLHKAEQRRAFVDIGANIGRYSVIAGKSLRYSRILAVEANPVTFEILKKNIALNDLGDKVRAEHVAVGEKEGEIFIQANSYHLGGGNVIGEDSSAGEMENKYKVRMVTVDSLIAAQGLDVAQIDFIKMDVEGMEAKVLDGMTNTLSGMSAGSLMMIEISDREDDRTKKSLFDHGFDLLESKANDFLFRKR